MDEDEQKRFIQRQRLAISRVRSRQEVGQQERAGITKVIRQRGH